METPTKEEAITPSPFAALSDNIPKLEGAGGRAKTEKGRQKTQRNHITPSKFFTPSPHTVSEKLSDRFIPCRSGTNLFDEFFNKLGECSPNPRNEEANRKTSETSKESQNLAAYSNLLESQMLGGGTTGRKYINFTECVRGADLNNTFGGAGNRRSTGEKGRGNGIYMGGSAGRSYKQLIPKQRSKVLSFKSENIPASPFTQSPLLLSEGITPEMLTSIGRKIPKVPFKVLDAPKLQDDFYLNLVDWGAENMVAVGLANEVYIWSAHNSKVTKLCKLGGASLDQTVSSVIWEPKGHHLAVGNSAGLLQIWDCAAGKLIREMEGHTDRVGTSAWSNQLLSTGTVYIYIYIYIYIYRFT